MKEFIQLKISIKNSQPLIWREILVHQSTTFFELHHIIQIVMGWQNYHLFEFNLEGYRIGIICKGPAWLEDSELIDSSTIKLSDMVGPKELISYLYDFGDYWEHQIEVVKFLDADHLLKYPVCIGGAMRCPPEDCGGLDGYYNNLKILKDKKHPEYKETAIWMGRRFNPELFNMEKVNKQLNRLNKYIEKWLLNL